MLELVDGTALRIVDERNVAFGELSVMPKMV